MTQLVKNTALGEFLPLTNGTEGQVMAITSGIPAWTAVTTASASSSTPAALGVAAVGSGTTFARADHVHSSTVPKLTFTTATNGILAGSGASAGRTALGTTAGNALEFYLDATHTSGDMRGIYANTTFSAAGGSGETLRAFSIINNITAATGGTVNGGHISLEVDGASGKVSGAANALRCTFGANASASAIGGTCATIQVDTDFASGSALPPNFAFLRFTNTNTLKAANLARIPVPINGAGLLFCAHITDAMTHSIRIVDENGVAYYLMATTTVTGRSTS